jgi:uncharacterized protein with ACT and thioredoxin-like domain
MTVAALEVSGPALELRGGRVWRLGMGGAVGAVAVGAIAEGDLRKRFSATGDALGAVGLSKQMD